MQEQEDGMKIVVASSGADLDSEVDARYGRCAWFLVVDPDDMSFEAIENANASLGGGAGVQSGQLAAASGAKAVLAGHCGPKAFSVLSAAGIEVIVGVSGPVREAVQNYKEGKLSSSDSANVGERFGMGEGD